MASGYSTATTAAAALQLQNEDSAATQLPWDGLQWPQETVIAPWTALRGELLQGVARSHFGGSAKIGRAPAGASRCAVWAGDGHGGSRRQRGRPAGAPEKPPNITNVA